MSVATESYLRYEAGKTAAIYRLADALHDAYGRVLSKWDGQLETSVEAALDSARAYGWKPHSKDGGRA